MRDKVYCLIVSVALLLISAHIQAKAQENVHESPEFIPQIGHTHDILDMVFSPDNSLLATSSEDETVNLWDVGTGRILRTMHFPSSSKYTNEIKSVLFVNDSHTLLAGGSDGTIHFVDVKSGSEIGQRLKIGSGITALAFIQEDRILVAGDETGDITAWLLGRDRVVELFHNSYRMGNISAVRIDRAKHEIIAVSRYRVYTRMDFAGHLLFSRPLRADAGSSESTSDVTLDLSGEQVVLIASRDSASPGIGIWSPLVDTFAYIDSFAEAVAVSPLREEIVCFCGKTKATNGLAFFSLKDKHVLRRSDTFNATIYGVSKLAFSNSGRYLAIADRYTHEIMVADLLNNVLVPQFSIPKRFSLDTLGFTVGKGVVADVRQNLLISADGTQVFNSDIFDTTVWDLTLGIPSAQSEAMSWIRHSEIADHQKLGYTPSAYSVSLTGQVFAVGGPHGEMAFSTFKDPYTWHPLLYSDDVSHCEKDVEIGLAVNTITISRSGHTLAAGTYCGLIHVFSLIDGSYQSTYRLGDKVDMLAISADDKLIAAAHSESRLIQIWNIAKHHSVSKLRYEGRHPTSLIFGNSLDSLFSGYDDGSLLEWNIRKRRVVHRLTGHSDEVTSLQIDTDRSLLYSVSYDKSLRMWDISKSVELFRGYTWNNASSWLGSSPNGLFDLSPDAWSKCILGFRKDTLHAFPCEAIMKQNLYPGLLQSLFLGDHPASSPILYLLHTAQYTTVISAIGREGAEFAPIPTNLLFEPASDLQGNILSDTMEPSEHLLSLKQSGAPNEDVDAAAHKVLEEYGKVYKRTNDTAERTTAIHIRIEAAKTSTDTHIRDVHLLRNNRLIKEWPGRFQVGPDHSFESTTPATLTHGNNIFTAYAFDDKGIKIPTSLPLPIITSARQQSHAYIVSIGVNAYQDAAITKLSVAESDAQLFADKIANVARSSGKYDRIVPVLLLGPTATRRNIMAVFDVMGGNGSGADVGFPELGKVNPEDIIFVYFAGHSKSTTTGFYLLPYDASSVTALSTINEYTITGTDLSNSIRHIEAEHIVLILDSCQSGALLQSGEDIRPGPWDSRDFAQLAWDRGVYVLAASQSDELAEESSILGHSLLIKALVVDALSRQPRSGALDIREWFKYAIKRVPILARQIGSDEPQIPRAFIRSDVDSIQVSP